MLQPLPTSALSQHLGCLPTKRASNLQIAGKFPHPPLVIKAAATDCNSKWPQTLPTKQPGAHQHPQALRAQAGAVGGQGAAANPSGQPTPSISGAGGRA